MYRTLVILVFLYSIPGLTVAENVLADNVITEIALADISTAGNALKKIAPARQSELLHLLKHDCGSCHGLTMAGGLGPALTPESLAGKPAELLLNTIRDGRPGTPMPPWRNILTEQEIVWLLGILEKGVVDEVSP